MKTLISTQGILMCLLVTAAFATEPWPNYDFHGSLYKALFYGKYYENDIVISQLPQAMQQRMQIFFDRRNGFHSQLEPPAVKGRNREYKMVSESGYNKKYAIELAIFNLIDKQGIADSAASYAQKAELYFEWEGFSEGPLTEAHFAEAYIREHTGTPIKPYLILFLLDRYRSAFECLVTEKDNVGQVAAAAKYMYWLDRARAENDPLIGSIANDLDRQAYIYLDVGKHPDWRRENTASPVDYRTTFTSPEESGPTSQ